MAHPCAHPSCHNTASKRCSGCEFVWYCSEQCQREHWKAHKTSCRQAQQHKRQARSAERIRDTTNKADHKENENEVQVLWEDQQRINRFSRINLQYANVRDAMKNKTREAENIHDAINEIDMLIDEDSTKMKMGEVFIDTDNDEAAEFTKKQQQKVQNELSKLKEEATAIEQEMTALKTALYAKFGKSINLEADETD